MSGWQPIETAPKDGRKIDVWFRPTGTGPGIRGCDIFWSKFNDYWSIYEIKTDEVIKVAGMICATHWRELPAEPGCEDESAKYLAWIKRALCEGNISAKLAFEAEAFFPGSDGG
jgi:hypothetical protein